MPTIRRPESSSAPPDAPGPVLQSTAISRMPFDAAGPSGCALQRSNPIRSAPPLPAAARKTLPGLAPGDANPYGVTPAIGALSRATAQSRVAVSESGAVLPDLSDAMSMDT